MTRRALEYPYGRPGVDFLYLGGEWMELAQVDAANPPGCVLKKGGTVGSLLKEQGVRSPADWISVAAYGSNRSPEQLARKFPEGVPVVSARGWLMDTDALRSAHFSSYGTLPATPATSPGTRLAVSLQWFPRSALPRLHASEGLGRNYIFARLPAGKLVMPGGAPAEAWIYTGLHGAARLQGAVSAFNGLEAQGRLYPAHSQREALELARRQLGAAEELGAWLERLGEDKAYREAMTLALKGVAAL